jgi:nucleotide-binding universal stress UspA family protein
MNAVVHMLQALRSSSVRAAAGGLSDRARQAGIRAVAASRGGDAEDSILAYAEEIATTFICLPGSDGGLGAKVAKGVMRHASCPVLVGSTAPAPVSRCS